MLFRTGIHSFPNFSFPLIKMYYVTLPNAKYIRVHTNNWLKIQVDANNNAVKKSDHWLYKNHQLRITHTVVINNCHLTLTLLMWRIW
jgi:hypothetical protein